MVLLIMLGARAPQSSCARFNVVVIGIARANKDAVATPALNAPDSCAHRKCRRRGPFALTLQPAWVELPRHRGKGEHVEKLALKEAKARRMAIVRKDDPACAERSLRCLDVPPVAGVFQQYGGGIFIDPCGFAQAISYAANIGRRLHHDGSRGKER